MSVWDYYTCHICKGHKQVEGSTCTSCFGKGIVAHIVWERTEYFCLNCGENQVYRALTPELDDFYLGQPYYCTTCAHGFYVPGGVEDKPLYTVDTTAWILS